MTAGGFQVRAAALLGVLCLAASCAGHRFQFPTGAGTPAADAAAAWAEATEACRDVRSFSAEMRPSGHVGGQRLGGTIHGAVTAADQIHLEMPASFGDPYFVLAGSGARATLVRNDKRVLTAQADEILDALIGLKLSPRQLLAIFAGCVDQSPSVGGGARFGQTIAVSTDRARVFLQPVDGRWRPVAAELGDLRIEYTGFGAATPGRVAIRSTSSVRIDLSVALDQIEVNGEIPASAFIAALPAGAQPLTLEQLRQSGPLGDRKR
jgi:hypothetical protein